MKREASVKWVTCLSRFPDATKKGLLLEMFMHNNFPLQTYSRFQNKNGYYFIQHLNPSFLAGK